MKQFPGYNQLLYSNDTFFKNSRKVDVSGLALLSENLELYNMLDIFPTHGLNPLSNNNAPLAFYALLQRQFNYIINTN